MHTNIAYNWNLSFHTSLPNLKIALVTWRNNKYDTEVFFLINSTLLEKLAELFSSQFTRTAYILHTLFFPPAKTSMKSLSILHSDLCSSN